ncbi:MAG: sigma 54-interacting transcriptional regulator [Vicinamibacterales bacterium]
MNPTLFPTLMVETAAQRGLDQVLRTLVQGLARCPNVVLARIWLVLRRDECPTCVAAAPETGRALHLVASAGNSSDARRDYGRTAGAFHEFALGARKIGTVAMTGEALLATDAPGGQQWAAEPEWARAEGVRTLAAQPLIFGGEVLGVLALFDRAALDHHALEWLRIFADYAAVSIANSRALEEIEGLKRRLEDENSYLKAEVSDALGMGGIIGQSPSLQKVLRQVQLVATTDAAVLIEGESGTGKELVARAIHDASGRRDRALIKVNCSAIPDTLFESEFFGHVRGAFTGAAHDRPGRFELAHGGTLFLDEIGEVPLALQPKLLRVLQEHELERVGDTRTRRVDVRVIAATNRDLKQEVDAGRFRQDLFYRLSVFPIGVPPLRERREDVPLLVQHFAALAAKRLRRPAPRIRPADLARLAALDWPGNIRELQNFVERAIIVSQTGPLRLAPEPAPPSPPPVGVTHPPLSAPTQEPLTRADLRQLERDSILRALERTGGKVSGADGAAELLGVRPTTLASRIAALGLRDVVARTRRGGTMGNRRPSPESR